MSISDWHNRLTWFRNRLRVMSPNELASRVYEAGVHAILMMRARSFEGRVAGLPRRSGRLPGINGHLNDIDWETRDRVLSVAVPWLNHRGRLFDHQEVRLGETIDWHRDYSTGVRAPLKYSALINHRDPKRVGNVKCIWELNRLQHLVPLILSLKWTEREAYRREVERQIASWCRENPFMRGLNWKSPLEAALRLITWGVITFVTEGSLVSRPDLEPDVLKAIYLQQYFIRRFHSRHSSANNHLVGEMAGLYVACTLWPVCTRTEKWRAFARETLVEEVLRQTEPDGVHRERALEYQLFVCEFLLLAGALGEATGDPFPRDFWERLSRMIEFVDVVRDRSGNFPILGDNDNGQVISLGDDARRRAASLAALLGNGSGRREDADLRRVLLLWGQGSDQLPFRAVGTSRQASLQSFPEGGYYLLAADRGTEDEIVVLFDVGVFGLPPLYAHAHADALSFWLSYGGCEFLIDPGTYCYDWSEWRRYFRSTAAHNTVRIDGLDQAEQAGTFLWKRPVHAHLAALEDVEGSVEIEGWHDGYRRLGDPVTHYRRLRLFKKSHTLAIVDRLECHSSHEVEILFHFSPSCRVAQVKSNCFLVTNSEKALLVQLDPRLQLRIEQGATSPIFGWYSPAFGFKQPAVTLVGKALISGSVPFFSEISPA
ncbi:MAG: alginate lyase family protein [Acidobacteriota bacterium]